MTKKIKDENSPELIQDPYDSVIMDDENVKSEPINKELQGDFDMNDISSMNTEYRFNPQKNITTLELAEVIGGIFLIVNNTVYDNLSEETKRHFEILKEPEKPVE